MITEEGNIILKFFDKDIHDNPQTNIFVYIPQIEIKVMRDHI